ncbi:MAG: ABC transporter substrate-binding protein, partial [Pigmentiphaga sp.]
MAFLTSLKAVAAAAALALAAPAVQAADAPPIRIGYAVSKTGPYAGGATVTTVPNYELWAAEVNAAGGIALADGKRAKIELIEYDDRSNSEEAVRAIERLINHDKVDFVLPPWGTALNLAVGPIFDRHGYPQLAVTSVSDRIPQLRDRWPNAFFFSSTSAAYAEGIVDLLTELRKADKIKGTVAMVNVADQFGIELANAARKGLTAAGFEVVYSQSYP